MTVDELVRALSDCNGRAEVRIELGEYADSVESIDEQVNDVILRAH